MGCTGVREGLTDGYIGIIQGIYPNDGESNGKDNGT